MYTNLVFSGGGILGIAYLGVVKYLEEINVLKNIKKVAGTSAGAITALINCFNLDFNSMKMILDSINYARVIEDDDSNQLEIRDIKEKIEMIYGNASSLYRLIKNYGWHSTNYIYTWISNVINSRFDSNLKKPPYTFRDFRDMGFKDLYIIGTNLNTKSSVVFAYETTPDMEVALAVKISISIPFLFESTIINDQVFVDGGVMRNYPIDIFDKNGFNNGTLGIKFNSRIKENKIDNILDFSKNISMSYLKKEDDMLKNNLDDINRTIEIDTGNISSLNFNIKKEDPNYIFLYNKGYQAAYNFFKLKSRYYQ